jgi:hypothetical protein
MKFSGLRVLPIFMDGSPYSSGNESRLNQRYAVISALGAAGYMPEESEHIRYFKWDRNAMPTDGVPILPKLLMASLVADQIASEAEDDILIPFELFVPKAKLQNKPQGKHVLVLWLKEEDTKQDTTRKPLKFLNTLLRDLKNGFLNKFQATKLKNIDYTVLGPRFSTGLGAMLKELKEAHESKPGSSSSHSSPYSDILGSLNGTTFISPWATAEDIFLLDSLPDEKSNQAAEEPGGCGGKGSSDRTIERLFACAGITLIRTVKTDAVLAEALLDELKRRKIDLTNCFSKPCEHNIALISEWDTLYGRALPRTFVAVAMNGGRSEPSPGLEAEINKLRRDEWPEQWVYRASYLVGLDGELPAKVTNRENESKNKGEHDNPLMDRKSFERYEKPDGRSQLDYIRRLALSLKQEQTRSKPFSAIGVLGGDVYDKMLILQALKPLFPRATFFTTDLSAMLADPIQWRATRNLVIASHFGLELGPELQSPIPPFRDSYQTSLFYATLQAVEHFCFEETGQSGKPCQAEESYRSTYFRLANDKDNTKFFSHSPPRLYEIGRHGPFDISIDAPPPQDGDKISSIHPSRPDIELIHKTLMDVAAAAATVFIIIISSMLVSSTVADAFQRFVTNVRTLATNRLFWLVTVIVIASLFGILAWIRFGQPLEENEPFVFTEGISVWPATAICLLALLMSIVFIWYSWRTLKKNEQVLAQDFGLEEKDGSREFQNSLEFTKWLRTWRPLKTVEVDAKQLWREYLVLGKWQNRVQRVGVQIVVACVIVGLLIKQFDLPNLPCRGESCFGINQTIILFANIAQITLIFYVIDTTRLCRKWVYWIATTKVEWPKAVLIKNSRERNVSEENLGEWLGIELISKRTAIVGNFIYFPFITAFFLFTSRHTYIDGFDFPISLVLIFALTAILVVTNSLALRRSAKMAKARALTCLENKLNKLSEKMPDEEKQKKEIEWAINAIENNERGAFLPFHQHPVFATALPSGAYGLLILAEYLTSVF